MMHSDGKGCPMGQEAATTSGAPPGFCHFLGKPDQPFTWNGKDPRHDAEALQQLRSDMDSLAAAMQNAPDPTGKCRLPAGYTYVLQLVAHDMVDTSLPFWAGGRAAQKSNRQTQPLRLNTLYGGGPGQFLPAFAPDPNANGERIAFRLGNVIGDRSNTSVRQPNPPGRDIPRASLGATTGGTAAGLDAALLADPRNDQHLLLSQTVVLFMALHNAILGMLPPARRACHAGGGLAAADERFSCARAATELIYRAILRRDILPRILHPDISALYAKERPLFGPTWQGVPLEFSHGAFRFGHAMVRGEYTIPSPDVGNRLHRIEDIVRLNSHRLPAELPFDAKWIVDWANFLPLGAGNPANMARPIGATAQVGLGNPDPFSKIHAMPPTDGLAIRDLMSAGLAGLWSVWPLLESIAKRLHDTPLATKLRETKAEWKGGVSAWCAGVPEIFRPGTEVVRALTEDPPFPFFVLLEAAMAGNHAGLGLLGSVVVAETVLGALCADPLPAEAAACDLRARLQHIGVAHEFGVALVELAAIDTLPGMVRFLADVSPWREAVPPLFSALA